MLTDKITTQRLLHEGLIYSAKKTPDKIGFIAEGVSYSYSQVLDATYKLANEMQLNGFKRGDRCVIYMDNTFPCVVSIYATLILGGVFVVVNPQTKSDKLEFILNDCQASVLITDIHLISVFENVIYNVSSLNCVISSGDFGDELQITLIKFNEILNKCYEPLKPSNVIQNDLAALIYTSGSTGSPKGVMHTHLSMTFALNSIIEYLRLNTDERILLVLPLAFDYGLYQLLMSVQLGATLILERSFTYPAQIFNIINNNNVTVFPAVPTIFSMILSMHGRNSLCFPTIRVVTNTAAALPAEYVVTLKDIFPSALIFKMYGLTECKRVCYLEPETLLRKPKSVGKAIPGTEVFILDEANNIVPPGQPGILYVRGSHIMLGYWNRPDLSKEMLVDGFLPGEKILSTNDWFKMDEDGDLYFLGRSDDIIKTRGEKVSPVEVENVLYGIDGVLEAAVIGVEDKLFGQAIKCFVVIENNSNLTVMDLKKVCVSKLENYMVPKYFEITDKLDKTVTGKISKKGMK